MMAIGELCQNKTINKNIAFNSHLILFNSKDNNDWVSQRAPSPCPPGQIQIKGKCHNFAAYGATCEHISQCIFSGYPFPIFNFIV